MNKGFIKGLVLTVAALTAFTTVASAKALRIDTRGIKERNLSSPGDIFCDDFTTGAPLESYGYTMTTPGSSSISIADTIGPNGKKQKALKLDDRVPGTANSGPTIRKDFSPVTSGKIGMEICFKMELIEGSGSTFASNGLYFRKGNTMSTRFYVLGDATGGTILYQDAKGAVAMSAGQKIVPGAWYTMKLNIDMNAKTADIILESKDGFSKGFTMETGRGLLTDVDSFDNVYFESRMFEATWYIDYFKVTTTPSAIKKPDVEIVKPEPIPAPKVATPVMRAVPNSVNIMRNGSYSYFTGKPLVSGEEVFVSPRGAFNLFGMLIRIENGKYVAKRDDDTVEISIDGSLATFNGSKIENAVMKNGENVLVSVNKLADALGETVVYDASTRTLIITKEVAAE